MKKVKLTPQGLQCANCSIKIEKKLNTLDFIEEAHLNFSSLTLYLTLKDHFPENYMQICQDVVDSIENGVVLTEYVKSKKKITSSCSDGSCSIDNHDHEHEHHEHQHDDHDHDHGTFNKTTFALLITSVVLFLIGIFLPQTIFKTIVFLASTLLSGYTLFIGGLKSLIKFRYDESTLITIAVIAAFFIGEYPEAALVTILFKAGTYLEDLAVNRSRKNIESLLDIRPDTANVILADGRIEAMNAEDVSIGQTIMIKAGDRVPIDCEIVDGTSDIDTSALTGESLPVSVGTGDSLLSGTINLNGVLTCKTTEEFTNSAASKIISLVEEAASKKGKTESFISRFAAVYTPIIIILAVLIAFVPPLFNPDTFTFWLNNALVFLVASCPCALVISIPLGFFSALGASSKNGVLIKGSKYVETLSKADIVVFDKTGTLTKGELNVSEICSVNNEYSEDDILLLAASAEAGSTHPMAKSILAKSGEQPLLRASDIVEVSGKGIICKIDSKEILVGSKKLMQAYNINVEDYKNANVYVAINGVLCGYIVLSDTIREDAAQTIKGLKSLGIKETYMLTGDFESAAKKVADEVGVDQYYAGLLPQDKVSMMKKINNATNKTIFVGDGINDAPVLALSDVGVAMGLGSDAAIGAADMVLMSSKPSSLLSAISIAKKSMSIIKFNIVFAFLVKAIVLVLGSIGFASIWLAVFADVGVSILSVLNASRILRIKV